MSKRTILVFASTCLLAMAALAQGQMKAKKTAKSSPAPVMMPAADLKWADLPGAPGVKIVDLWGDHAKGAFGAFIKFPAGFAAPLHTHTHEMRIAVDSGTFLQAPEGKPEVRLPSGSFLKQPGDGYRHTTGCDKASDCVVFAESGGKFDLIPAK
jgi:anti-sigma factor ChrR (cupin superfamily)